MLTDNQKRILQYMDRMKAGALFFDPDKKWIFRSEFRENASISDRYFNFKRGDIEQSERAALNL